MDPKLKEIENLKKELEVERKISPKDIKKISNKLYDIGRKYQYLGKYNDALNYLNECLVIDKQKLPDDHNDYAALLYTIGQIYSDQGKYDEALDYYERALKMIFIKRIFLKMNQE